MKLYSERDANDPTGVIIKIKLNMDEIEYGGREYVEKNSSDGTFGGLQGADFLRCVTHILNKLADSGNDMLDMKGAPSDFFD